MFQKTWGLNLVFLLRKNQQNLYTHPSNLSEVLMSINLEKFTNTAGLNFFAKQASHAADRLTELTFHVLDGATTSLGRLLPDLRPTSIGGGGPTNKTERKRAIRDL